MIEKQAIIDIETIPIDIESYEKLSEDDRKKRLNPIDSKIIAIGVRFDSNDKIFLDKEETKILKEFWKHLSEIKKSNAAFNIVGFNIKQFDIPFLVARSFILNVAIEPFFISKIIELRDKINAYRFGPTRGKLKDFAKLIGLNILDVNGSDVLRLWKEKNHIKIKEYLIHDLFMTEELYRRAKKTGILLIRKY